MSYPRPCSGLGVPTNEPRLGHALLHTDTYHYASIDIFTYLPADQGSFGGATVPVCRDAGSLTPPGGASKVAVLASRQVVIDQLPG